MDREVIGSQPSKYWHAVKEVCVLCTAFRLVRQQLGDDDALYGPRVAMCSIALAKVCQVLSFPSFATLDVAFSVLP